MLFVMRQTLNLSNQHLLTHISVNKMMIVIQCSALPDRRIQKKKKKCKRGRKSSVQTTIMEQYSACQQRCCRGNVDFQGLRQSHRIKNEPSLLCKSARQSMTKCPVSLSGGDSAE